jgi:hypothetical protein
MPPAGRCGGPAAVLLYRALGCSRYAVSDIREADEISLPEVVDRGLCRRRGQGWLLRFRENRRLLQEDDPRLDYAKSGLYRRYHLMVAMLLEKDGYTIRRLFCESPTGGRRNQGHSGAKLTDQVKDRRDYREPPANRARNEAPSRPHACGLHLRPLLETARRKCLAEWSLSSYSKIRVNPITSVTTELNP